MDQEENPILEGIKVQRRKRLRKYCCDEPASTSIQNKNVFRNILLKSGLRSKLPAITYKE
jgi:hypothetical protein